MAMKVRSLEQNMRNVKGLRVQNNISYKDLCLLPDLHFPLGFKTLMIGNYVGHHYPLSHSKKLCNLLSGVERKED